jgi:hypothetical protein
MKKKTPELATLSSSLKQKIFDETCLSMEESYEIVKIIEGMNLMELGDLVSVLTDILNSKESYGREKGKN